MENNSLPPSSPQQPYHPLSHDQSSNHWKAFAILLLTLFIVGITLSIFKYQIQPIQVQNIYQQKPPINNARPTAYNSEKAEQNQTSQPLLSKTGATINKVFYTKGYPKDNLFVYDDQTKTISQLTHYTDPQFYMSNIQVIDENSVGFLRCSTSGKYADCGIYAIDMTSKKITEKKQFERQMFVNTLAFASPDNFAYFGNMRNESKDILQLILIDQGIMKTLEQIDVSNIATGRGGFIADDKQIQFSQDKRYLLQIDTAARSTEDFNIYLYNLSNSEKQIIENATHPQWANNTTIVYRKYQSGGIYLYDIVNKTYKKIDGISQNAYYLSALPEINKILFTDNDAKQLWLYDIMTKENKKILDNAYRGFWLSPTKIVYDEIRVCTTEDQCGMKDYKNLSESLFDVEKMTKIGSIPDNSSTSDENYLTNMASYYSSQP